MTVSASTNDKLRELMASAQAHRSACNVSENALSSRHIQIQDKPEAAPKKGFLSNAKAAFAGLLEAFTSSDTKASPEAKQEVFKEVVRMEQASYYDVMARLNIDWASPIFPHDPYYTYAHKAAAAGMLPDHFAHWDLRDRTGASVAHIAAEKGHLPPSFNQWDITRGDGWTVAHEAAINGHLPVDVDPSVLDLTDVYGKTVRQCVEDHARHTEIAKFKAMTH